MDRGQTSPWFPSPSSQAGQNRQTGVLVCGLGSSPVSRVGLASLPMKAAKALASPACLPGCPDPESRAGNAKKQDECGTDLWVGRGGPGRRAQAGLCLE